MDRRSPGHCHGPSSSGSHAISRGSLSSSITFRGVLDLVGGLERDAELRLGIFLGADQHPFGPLVIQELRRIDG